MKYAVQGVILNDKGEVLAVSRKDDHNDMGLVGGKVDPEDLNPMEAMARETFEETGLRINTATMQVVFQMHKDGYMGITYLIKDWSGEIQTDEPHVVKWTTFYEIIRGSFGQWNALVGKSLDGMGVSYLKRPPIEEDYYFHVVGEELTDGSELNILITPKWYWDKEGCLADHWNEEDDSNIDIMVDDIGCKFDGLMESTFQLRKDGNLINDIIDIGNLMLSAGFKQNKDFSKFVAD